MNESEDSGARIEIIAATLLATAGLLSAWAGFQAALWGGVQATAYAAANAGQTEAARLDLDAGREETARMMLVHAWLDAAASGDDRRMTFYRNHLPAEQRRRFEEWRAKLPADMAHYRPGPDAPPLPLPRIEPPGIAASAKARAAAAASFAEGQDANAKGDRFIFATVLLSIVLFFAGISQLLKAPRPRLALLLLGAGLLVASIIYLATIPRAAF